MIRSIKSILPACQILQSKLDLDSGVTGISDDSRITQPGNIFFAVPGNQFDGSTFIRAAFEKGATAIIVDRESDYAANEKCILVASVRSSLAWTASAWHHHPSQKLHLVGITGTNGKTTSSYVLRTLWERIGLRAGLIGTLEYRSGTAAQPSPLTTPGSIQLQMLLAQMCDNNISHAAIEVSSIALNQHRTDGTHFRTALFTNLTQDHLDYHHSFENYYQAKRRLFCEHSLENAVINLDDPWGRRLTREISKSCRLTTFGLQPGTDITALNARFGFDMTTATLSIRGRHLEFCSSLIGHHNLINCLGMIGVCESLALDLPAVLSAFTHSIGVPGRLERVQISGPPSPSIFVDYAHTPDALNNVLTSIRSLREQNCPGARILTVFGCGGDRDRTKRPLMGLVVSQLSDVTIVTSDNPRTEDPDSIICDIEGGIDNKRTEHFRITDRAKAIGLALSIAKPDDIVLIAGKGHETHQIIGTSKLAFDDRQVIREYYKRN